jgi:Putative zinc-finger
MRPPTCREASSRLSLLLDGRLAPSDADRIGNHLEGCGRCQGEYEALASLRRALEALPTPEPRPDALARTRAALAPRRVRQPVAVLGLAAAALLVAVAYMGGRPRTDAGGGHAGPPLQEGAVTAGLDSRVRSAQPRVFSVATTPRACLRLPRHVAQRTHAAGVGDSAAPSGLAPSGRAIVIVCPSALAPDVATLPPFGLQPVLPAVEPGTASYSAVIDPGTGEPGSHLAVTRTVGDDLSVESVSIAYQPALPGEPADPPDTRTEEEDTSHVRPTPEDAGPVVAPMPRLVGDLMPSGLV